MLNHSQWPVLIIKGVVERLMPICCLPVASITGGFTVILLWFKSYAPDWRFFAMKLKLSLPHACCQLLSQFLHFNIVPDANESLKHQQDDNPRQIRKTIKPEWFLPVILVRGMDLNHTHHFKSSTVLVVFFPALVIY